MHGERRDDEVPEPVHGSFAIAAYYVYPTGYDDVPEAPDRERWRLSVVDAGDGWAVRRGRMCLNIRGQFEFEPPVHARTPEFLWRCRFPEGAALHRARTAVDIMAVDGLTFRRYVEQYRNQTRQKAHDELRKNNGSLWQRLSGGLAHSPATRR